eukprot:TRINITY_DN23565_c0_g1_i1.p2 TRINITY_DN23565_c0_g1~~TRINITY_DN23565_c0_g1_i1.p2  ORF type:complete len:243 (-),score=-15.00 TRINITY_DN23565_c0_g1_i1:283-969(-)
MKSTIQRLAVFFQNQASTLQVYYYYTSCLNYLQCTIKIQKNRPKQQSKQHQIYPQPSITQKMITIIVHKSRVFIRQPSNQPTFSFQKKSPLTSFFPNIFPRIYFITNPLQQRQSFQFHIQTVNPPPKILYFAKYEHLSLSARVVAHLRLQNFPKNLYFAKYKQLSLSARKVAHRRLQNFSIYCCLWWSCIVISNLQATNLFSQLVKTLDYIVTNDVPYKFNTIIPHEI